MNIPNEKQLAWRIRKKLLIFIVLLILSGLTAFPVETELRWLMPYKDSWHPFIGRWLGDVYEAVKYSNTHYPFLAYGTDWLAFSHIVIATAFIGPYREPVRNIWVVQFGMIACMMVFPLAFIAGCIRQIPFIWQLTDCSFGVFGLLLLYNIYKNIRTLELKYNQLY